MAEYGSWKQVAGYFDGDGTIAISDTSNMPYKLGLSLVFVDQSYDQIRMLQDFLKKRGIPTSNMLRTSKGTAWIIAIGSFNGVRECLRRMIPHLFKKAIEAQSALDYYEGKITGNDLFAVFQQEVEAGRRERHVRKVTIDVPYSYPVGDKAMKQLRVLRLRDAFGRYRAKVLYEDFQRIREAYFKGKTPLRELIKEYPQYSRTTIRRVLGRDRASVLVKSLGLVTTLPFRLQSESLPTDSKSIVAEENISGTSNAQSQPAPDFEK